MKAASGAKNSKNKLLALAVFPRIGFVTDTRARKWIGEV